MRIIAGDFRGRKLLAPSRDTTRPITDRVKQSLFDIIAPDLPDAVVFDCFAGTGSMGLESLSRGARLAYFFESDRSAIGLLKTNIDTLAIKDRTRLVAGDLFKWFAQAILADDQKATVIFLDPPYRFVVERSGQIRELVTQMRQRFLADGGYIVFRHDVNDNLGFADVKEVDRREYGGMVLRFLRPQPTTPESGTIA